MKWNFTTPRPEFTEQLRDQLEKNFSPSIIELLMHRDFQKHIMAIQMLYGVRLLHISSCCVFERVSVFFTHVGYAVPLQALDQLKAETLANIDLLLKWFTLRFFETNPSMLNKALEYLLALFKLMADEGQRLTSTEAESFIPYLIIKVDDIVSL